MAKKRKKSICIDCVRSGGSCSWSSRCEPVEGWEADYIGGGGGRLPSYCVNSCPLFEKEKPRSQTTWPKYKSDEFYRHLIAGGKDHDKAGV